MKHILFTHYPLTGPLAVVVGGWTSLAIVVPGDVRWLVVAFAFNGILQVGALYLLARQYLWHINVGGQALDGSIASFRSEAASVDAKVAAKVEAAVAPHAEAVKSLREDVDALKRHPLLRRPGG